MTIFIIATIVAGLSALVFVFLRRRSGGSERPLTSLVFLMSQPRVLSEEQVREAIERVWDVKLGYEMEQGRDFLVECAKVNPAMLSADAKNYFVSANDRTFLVNSVSKPYSEDIEESAKEIPDVRLRKAIGSHRAWNSVDLFGDAPAEAEKREIYAVLGRLLAEFAGDDCLAIFCPELDRCNEYSPAMIQTLQAGKPLELFEAPTNIPIVELSDDDPRMIAAVEEARRRWPEFVAAFQNRAADRVFGVKAKFSEGDDDEFMWLIVEKIEGDSITGRLDNTPAYVKNVKEGDILTVQAGDLNDWLYEKDGEHIGGFTTKVMTEDLNK